MTISRSAVNLVVFTQTSLAALSRRSIREVIAPNQIEPIDATMNHTDNGFSLRELNQRGVIPHAARRKTDDNELAGGRRRSHFAGRVRPRTLR
jgi:hypothetical protein